jgi:hypothetical protein
MVQGLGFIFGPMIGIAFGGVKPGYTMSDRAVLPCFILQWITYV